MFIYFRELLYVSLNTSGHIGISKKWKKRTRKRWVAKDCSCFCVGECEMNDFLVDSCEQKRNFWGEGCEDWKLEIQSTYLWCMGMHYVHAH